eukprot:1153437-Pelagomonas_calceolata.AAC.1
MEGEAHPPNSLPKPRLASSSARFGQGGLLLERSPSDKRSPKLCSSSPTRPLTFNLKSQARRCF